MAKRALLLVAIIALALSQKISAVAANVPQGEWIIVVGGVSMRQWEQYKAQPHDHWWANFVHAARIRTEQLRAQLDPSAPITWLVYKPSAGGSDGARRQDRAHSQTTNLGRSHPRRGRSDLVNWRARFRASGASPPGVLHQ
jgi:hypothetical protein